MEQSPPNLVLEKLVLVLTASVDPKGMPGQSRNDPAIREADYIEALKFYVNLMPEVRRIVFIENSGWPLDRLRNAARCANTHDKEVEFISLNCNDFPRQKGKGYGECLLLHEGIQRSRLVEGAGHIAKMTGRLRLLNAVEILRRIRRPFDLLCDLRDHCLYDIMHKFGMKRRCGHHADTRFFVFTPEMYYRYIDPLHEVVDESRMKYMEPALYEVAKLPELGNRAIRRFPIEPEFCGIGNWHGVNYGGLRWRLKGRMRGLCRRFLPWLHI